MQLAKNVSQFVTFSTGFGIYIRLVNKFKKDEIARSAYLVVKHGVIKMKGVERIN